MNVCSQVHAWSLAELANAGSNELQATTSGRPVMNTTGYEHYR